MKSTFEEKFLSQQSQTSGQLLSLCSKVLFNIGHGANMAENGSDFTVSRHNRVGVNWNFRGCSWRRLGWRWRSARGENHGQQEKKREERRREERRCVACWLEEEGEDSKNLNLIGLIHLKLGLAHFWPTSPNVQISSFHPHFSHLIFSHVQISSLQPHFSHSATDCVFILLSVNKFKNLITSKLLIILHFYPNTKTSSLMILLFYPNFNFSSPTILLFYPNFRYHFYSLKPKSDPLNTYLIKHIFNLAYL